MSRGEYLTNLYADLIGPAWAGLPEAVHRAHLTGEQMEASATFRIRRGTNWLARLMAGIARLPGESEAAPVQLSVRRVPRGELWDRSFGGSRLVSTQFDAGDGLLGEDFGLNEVRFRLVVRGSTLVYTQQSAFIRLGGLRVRIPQGLAVQISATESAAEDGVSPHIVVSVSAPVVGLLVTYEGDLNVKGMAS